MSNNTKIILTNGQKLFGKYLAGSFSYGFYRGIGSKNRYSEKEELYTSNISYSIINGIIYANPGVLLCKLYDLTQRIEIKLRGKNPKDYSSCYSEFGRINYNTI